MIQYVLQNIVINENTVNQTAPSVLMNNRAWGFMEQFLTTAMMYPEMEDVFFAYLGDQYSPHEWVEARDALWSGEGNNEVSLENLLCVKDRYLPRVSQQTQFQNKFVLLKASEDDDDKEEWDDEEEEQDDDDDDGTSVSSPQIMQLPGTLAKERLAATINNMVTRFEENPPKSSQGHQGTTYRDTLSSGAILSASHQFQTAKKRMYLLRVQRTSTEYIAEHFWRQQFPVTISPWAAGQLYVVTDSFKTIVNSIPASHASALKECIHIAEAEREAVEHSCSELPNQAWVRIRDGKYKGDIAQVFNPSLPNGFVAVLIASRNLPYPISWRSALLKQSCLPNTKVVSDILCDGTVVGLKYKGESYYMGLLLKNFPCDHLEPVASPHVDDIHLHLQSGWDKPFLKKTVVAFSAQFLHVGDSTKVVQGSLRGQLSKVVSTDHSCSSVGLELDFDDGGGSFKVLPGSVPFESYAAITTAYASIFQAPLDSESIEIGDNIQVWDGPHAGKFSIVTWITTRSTYLWFCNICIEENVDITDGLSSISVPIAFIQCMNLMQTLQYMKERGYDIRPGDTVSVVHGPEYQGKGFVHSVNYPNARLTLVCDGDRSLVTILLRFVAKIHNTNLDAFCNDTGKEVFIIKGNQKGYRATLYSYNSEHCIIALPGQQCTKLKLQNIVTRYGMRLDGVILEGTEFVSFCDMWKRLFCALPPQSTTPPVEGVPTSSTPPVEGVPTSITDPTPSLSSPWSTSPENFDKSHNPMSGVNPNPSQNNPWIVDEQDIREINDARAGKPQDSSLISWLMSKEFALKLFKYHVVLKVTPRFKGGWLAKRFVSTACPDPFCRENGLAPEGYVTAANFNTVIFPPKI
ncbi:hypothetical protein BDR04DRAFT_1120628 [Suillus decipiens]|nr:hypothetical protein BDR04DRAFT_1120628 [Suillus decipiens]